MLRELFLSYTDRDMCVVFNHPKTSVAIMFRYILNVLYLYVHTMEGRVE